MSKITRQLAKIFASNAGTDEIAKFGSLAAGTPVFSTDPTVIQSLGNWLGGWFSGVEAGNSPAIEDMNAFCYVMAYQTAYLMQEGIAEWNTDTVYYIGSLVQDGLGNIFLSKTDNNTGNALSSTTNWKLLIANSTSHSANPNCINLGLKYSAGTLSICASDGSNLSTSNLAQVIVPSASTAGKTVTLTITSNISITDTVGGTDLNALLWGTTTGRAWGSIKPFYLYAANLDDTDANLSFFLCGVPNLETVASNANYLGYKATAPSSSDHRNQIFLRSSTPSSYTSKPVSFIGAITMTKDTSNNWTIHLDGSGALQKNISLNACENIVFTMPVGQNGANSSSYFQATLATPPSWSSSAYNYQMRNSGQVYCNFNFGGTATNGSTNSDMALAMPIVSQISSWTSLYLSGVPGTYVASTHSPASGFFLLQSIAGSMTSPFIFYDLTSATTLKGNDFSSSSDRIFGSFIYNV